jgi:hypothetical protein
MTGSISGRSRSFEVRCSGSIPLPVASLQEVDLYSPNCLGTFERNLGGLFMYRDWKSRNDIDYTIRDAQTSRPICTLPKEFNAWQASGQIKIWLLAKGLITAV